MSMDYHGAREAWLDRLHRWLMFIVIIAGATALIDVVPVARYAGPLIAALAGTLDLTFDLSTKARDHAMFRRQYGDILADATREPEALIAAQCRMDRLSGEEPPAYHALLALSAVKAQQQTYGCVDDPCRPGWFARLLKNVVRFDGRDFNNPGIAAAG